MTKPNRAKVADLMRRQAPADLARVGDMPMLAIAQAAPAPTRKPVAEVAEPANRRVKLSLTATQEAALKKKAGDVPLARWIVRYLVRNGVISKHVDGSG